MTGVINGSPTLHRLARLAAVMTVALTATTGAILQAQGPSPDANLEPLLQGNPRARTIAQIPPALVRAIQREYERSPELRAESTFEAYLASRYFWLMDAADMKKGTLRGISKAVAPMCADGTCDAPLDPNVWSGSWTGATAPPITDANLPIAAWTTGIAPNNNSILDTACGPHAAQAHHSIVPAGNDPEIPGLSTVAPTPTANPASLRLGNRCTGYGGERVTKTFTVTPGQTTLQFWYALVFEDPGHPPASQPAFGAFLLNGSSLVSGRIDLDPTTPGQQELVVAGPSPFFGRKPGTNLVYRDWTCVTVDLSGLEGQTVTLVLANRDCGAGGHWGNTYVDSFCLGCKGSVTGDASFNSAQTACSQGKICFDYTVPSLPNGTTGTVNLTLNVYQNGVLAKTLTSSSLTASGTYCFSGVSTGLPSSGGYDWQATASFAVPGGARAPIDIGKPGEGYVPGNNNDCVPPVNPCCPPWNRDRLAESLFYQGSGSIAAPYTLKFQPTALLKSQMQTYIDYLHALNPAMQAITMDWRLHDQGTGAAPSTPLGPQVGTTSYTTWNSPGTGNPVISGDPNFFSPYPLLVGTWYRVHTGIYLENGQVFFPDVCAENEIWVRVQVIKGQAETVLEIWGRDNLIRRVPLKGGGSK